MTGSGMDVVRKSACHGFVKRECSIRYDRRDAQVEAFLGQIMPFAFNWAPKGTALAQGQLLPINQNQALFALLGTTYGGDGRSTFALPNLGGRAINGAGMDVSPQPYLGTVGGTANETLTVAQMPQHTHQMNVATSVASGASPAGALPGAASAAIFGAPANLVPLGAAPPSQVGGNQAHSNMQPSLVINYTIVIAGIYPSRG